METSRQQIEAGVHNRVSADNALEKLLRFVKQLTQILHVLLLQIHIANGTTKQNLGLKILVDGANQALQEIQCAFLLWTSDQLMLPESKGGVQPTCELTGNHNAELRELESVELLLERRKEVAVELNEVVAFIPTLQL